MCSDSSLTLSEKDERDCLENLKNFIKKNQSLEKFTSFFTDDFLLHFVRGKKYQCEIAYETLQNYIHIRREKHHKFFQTVKPSLVSVLEEDHHLHVLKYGEGKHKRLVIYDRAVEWDPKICPMEEALKKWLLIFEEGWNEKFVEMNGAVIIFDTGNMSLNQIPPLCNMLIWQKAYDIFLKTFPMKIKEVHVVNESLLTRGIFKLTYPLAPKKIQQRFHVHGNDMKSLHKFLPPEILPESLGGFLTDDEAFQDQAFFQRIKHKEEYYRKFSQLLRNEPGE